MSKFLRDIGPTGNSKADEHLKEIRARAELLLVELEYNEDIYAEKNR